MENEANKSKLPELLKNQKEEVLGQYYHNKKNMIKLLIEPSKKNQAMNKKP